MKAPTTFVTAMDVTKAKRGGMKPGVANNFCACEIISLHGHDVILIDSHDVLWNLPILCPNMSQPLPEMYLLGQAVSSPSFPANINTNTQKSKSVLLQCQCESVLCSVPLILSPASRLHFPSPPATFPTQKLTSAYPNHIRTPSDLKRKYAQI